MSLTKSQELVVERFLSEVAATLGLTLPLDEVGVARVEAAVLEMAPDAPLIGWSMNDYQLARQHSLAILKEQRNLDSRYKRAFLGLMALALAGFIGTFVCWRLSWPVLPVAVPVAGLFFYLVTRLHSKK